jgi:hypothetical protein
MGRDGLPDVTAAFTPFLTHAGYASGKEKGMD